MMIKRVLLATAAIVLLYTTVQGGGFRRLASGEPAPYTAQLDPTTRTGASQDNRSPSGDIHLEGRCGEQPDGKKYVCRTGYCCGRYGFCGVTKEHCGEGCLFGKCEKNGTSGVVPFSESSSDRLSTSSAPPILRTCRTKGHVALTFDDGPGPQTSRLLDILEKAQAPAMFFVIGNRVDTDTGRKLVKRAFEDEHTLATHSYSHADFTTLSTAEIEEEMEKTVMAVAKELDGRKPRFFRLPYGAANLAVRQAIAGYIDIGWNLDSNDWRSRDADTIVADVARKLSDLDSAIVLMHDLHDFTVDSVERVIQKIREMGFRLVSMEECLGMNAYESESAVL